MQFLDNLKAAIREFFKRFFATFSTADPINSDEDYYKVKKWIKRTEGLYVLFSILAIFFTFIVTIGAILFNDEMGVPVALILFLSCTLMPVMYLITGWGYATLILNAKRIAKSVFRTARAGYEEGKKVQETEVTVTHEYGDTYKVSSRTNDKGFEFGMFAGMFQFLIWAFFCVYIGPFLTFKKLRASKENMKVYKASGIRYA